MRTFYPFFSRLRPGSAPLPERSAWLSSFFTVWRFLEPMVSSRPAGHLAGRSLVLFLLGLLLLGSGPTWAQSIDPTFNPTDAGFGSGGGANDVVLSVAVQGDGKILIGGVFTTYNGTARNRITRLNADGSPDTGFNPGTGADGPVNSVAVQGDGKILIGGNFSTYNGTARSRIVRLNADGSLDLSFDPGAGANGNVLSVAVQGDGKILIGGAFSTYNGTGRNRIARLNTDGNLDPGFNPGSGATSPVASVAVQGDGKILIGGGFLSYNDTDRSGIARLNADGSLDTSFDPGSGTFSVASVAVQGDGKILIGGGFASYNGTARSGIARLNADGSLDTSFDPGSGFINSVLSVVLQGDGKILVGGPGYNGTARSRIARLNADGSLDPGFDPGAGANNAVFSVALQGDGKILIGGAFTSYNGTGHNRIARLLNSAPVPTITGFAASPNPVCAGSPATFTAIIGNVTGSYGYTLTNGTSPLSGTATGAAFSLSLVTTGSGPQTFTLTVTTGGGTATAAANLTVNPLPTPTIVGLPASICQEAAPVTLTGNPAGGNPAGGNPAGGNPAGGNPAGGVFTIDGLTATTFNPASLSVGQHSVVYSYTNTSGCSNTTSQMVTVKPTPQTPIIATQSGHSYPGGVSSLTASQNTGNVILMASGCSGGTITWQGGGSNTLSVSTMNTGVQTFTATCTSTGCTSPIATATVTVVGTTLSVLHRDGNGQLNTNTLAPYLQLNNQGNTAIPYQEITVRYWLTVENYAPLLFSINYAQLGNDKVHLKYVPAPTANPTATGYIEFSFDASAGSLRAGQNSGPIQDIINKQDYSYFDQSNDYSYANPGNFTPNERITAYRNGVLFYGMEPGPVTPTLSVKAQSQNNTGADANTIEAVLQVTNDGNQPINYRDLKVRYYFTADNTQPLVLSQAGYTALGSGNVTAQLVAINPPLAGADRYLEVSFSPGLGQLAPGSSTGGVTYQIRHADYSGFNQANDYSYQGTGGTMLNPHVVVFVAGQRVYGTEPGAGARLAVESAEVPLSVRVLGNPLTGSVLELEVTGAEGQPLRLQLSDSNGRVVGEQKVEQAGAVERQTLPVGGQSAGLLLLRVSTPNQSQTVKVLKIH